MCRSNPVELHVIRFLYALTIPVNGWIKQRSILCSSAHIENEHHLDNNESLQWWRGVIMKWVTRTVKVVKQCARCVKGMVHPPKNHILSSFFHSHVIPNLWKGHILNIRRESRTSWEPMTFKVCCDASKAAVFDLTAILPQKTCFCLASEDFGIYYTQVLWITFVKIFGVQHPFSCTFIIQKIFQNVTFYIPQMKESHAGLTVKYTSVQKIGFG